MIDLSENKKLVDEDGASLNGNEGYEVESAESSHQSAEIQIEQRLSYVETEVEILKELANRSVE